MNKPNILSFSIASKIPVSESIRQELLELDGVSYRLQREIELLESFDRVRCIHCQVFCGSMVNTISTSSLLNILFTDTVVYYCRLS